ncbi:hypothetical protein AA313_de0205593 [Arthrobotrys entomopaga]|nr:hypothetical protein AA313_de0205593 [Arthrobotrys entomopaga]
MNVEFECTSCDDRRMMGETQATPPPPIGIPMGTPENPILFTLVGGQGYGRE